MCSAATVSCCRVSPRCGLVVLRVLWKWKWTKRGVCPPGRQWSSQRHTHGHPPLPLLLNSLEPFRLVTGSSKVFKCNWKSVVKTCFGHRMRRRRPSADFFVFFFVERFSTPMKLHTNQGLYRKSVLPESTGPSTAHPHPTAERRRLIGIAAQQAAGGSSSV